MTFVAGQGIVIKCTRWVKDPSGALNHNVYSQDVVERYTISSVSCRVDRWSSQLVRCKALLYITDLSRLLCIAIEQIRKVLDQES